MLKYVFTTLFVCAVAVSSSYGTIIAEVTTPVGTVTMDSSLGMGVITPQSDGSVQWTGNVTSPLGFSLD